MATEYDLYRGKLPGGTYRLSAAIGEARIETNITLSDDATLEPQVIVNAGTLILRSRVAEGGPIDRGAGLNLTNAAGPDATYYGESTVIVPAGEITVNLRIGKVFGTQTATVFPGEVARRDQGRGHRHRQTRRAHGRGGALTGANLTTLCECARQASSTT